MWAGDVENAMKIKKIEITGFKSFCDRMVLEIEDPITAVVGPNGCGKSNIVDAIRWAMGEQSAKHLRGKSMDDVIFNGSESRGPAAYAEVTITFGNVGLGSQKSELDIELEAALAADDEADAALGEAAAAEGAAPAPGTEPVVIASEPVETPIDYSQYGEIAVTRRLYRDGTSEYEINKVPCRLKDITEFFLGTGVGTKAYSIIEQGRIGLIVSAKPEDRRALIEEAAGITKFKAKKRAAERKIEATRQNLLRVSDVTTEIDKRLGSLRRQAAKAERYKRFKTEVRDLELTLAAQRFLGLTSEARYKGGMLEELMLARDAAAAELASREDGLGNARLLLQADEQRANLAQEKLYECDNRLSLVVSQIEFTARETRELDQRVLEAESEAARLDGERIETEAEVARLEAELQQLDERAESQGHELAGREDALRELRMMLQGKQGALDAARAAVGREQQQIARGEEGVRAIERRIGDMDIRLERMAGDARRVEDRLGEASAEVHALERSLGDLRQLKLDLGMQKEQVESRVAELKQLLAVSQAEVETRSAELTRRRSRLHSLREIAERYEGFQRGVRSLMQQRGRGGDAVGQGLRGLVADVVQAPAELEVAVEAVLGERLGHVVVDDHAASALAIDHLKRRSEGRAGFISIASAAQLPKPEPLRLVKAAPVVVEAEAGAVAADVLPAPGPSWTEAARAALQIDAEDEAAFGADPFASGETKHETEHEHEHEHEHDVDAEAGFGADPLQVGGEGGGIGEVVGVVPVIEESMAADGGALQVTRLEVVHAAFEDMAVDVANDAVAETASESELAAEPAAGGATDEVVLPEGVRGPLLALVNVSSPELAPVAASLLGDVYLVDSLARGLELWQSGELRRTMVTFEGEVIDARGVVTGGSREAQGAGVLAQKREIRELEELVATLDVEFQDWNTRHLAHKGEIAALKKTLESLTSDAHSREMALLSHEKDAARGREEMRRLEARKEELARDAEVLVASRGEAEREAEEMRVANRAAEDRAATLESEQLALTEVLLELRGRVDDAQAQVTEWKVLVAQLGEKRGAARAEHGRQATRAERLAEQIARLTRSREEGSARAEELRGKVAGLVDERALAEEQQAALRADLEVARTAYETRGAELARSELDLRGVREQVRKLAEEATQHELAFRQLGMQTEVLIAQMVEKYRLDISREAGDYHLRPLAGEAEEARVRELRDQIERLGEINLMAIEECAELEQRYDFLTGQQKDLERALDQLEKAIAKINKTSRKLFRATFDAINKQFMELFPRLFRGGRAHLALTPSDDILEAGVEIFAQPPGKKNGTVELLSGGEKALTAVSMIFAIFLIKPSPFCLLDEVDAPLDEANVTRYNELVRQMTDRSQFIVITHNKRTMQIADTLYGITMQEPGISKLVSVNLKTLDQALKKAA